jgi:beta-galactosidase
MQKQSFNRDWHFKLGDAPGWEVTRPDESWQRVTLPHDWSIEMDRDPSAPNGVSVGFFPMGVGYYFKTIDAPQEWQGKKVLVEFEGVYMNAEAWLNENYLGRHPYGYTSFVFDLTPYLKIGQVNKLRVKVDNSHQGNSRWYSGSGIYRPAWLYVAEPVHIAHWGVSVTTPEVSGEKANVQAQVQVINESAAAQEVTVQSTIYGKDGLSLPLSGVHATIPSGQARDFATSQVVTAPQLWSPETPNLYRLESVVKMGTQVVDTETTTFGIRSIAWNATEGFLLNGQSIKMKGGCVHHDNGVMGAASYPRSEERKVALLKASGHNAIRCAHNPPAPSFLEACDRLGMLVMDEAFDCWREGKNPGDYHVSFSDWWERDIQSMVLRDRNHPSIVVWSIGNEVLERDGRSDGAAIAKALADTVRGLDPTRPVTSAICGIWGDDRTWIDTDPVFATLDLGGYNYQWRDYRSDHERHPERVMFGTETFPLEAFENWMSVLELPYVIGDFVWTSMDYLGESGIGRMHFDENTKMFLGEYPWHQAYCGDIDLAGFKRPQSYYRDIVWDNGARLYIAVHYPIPEGKTPIITRWGWPDVDANWTWPGMEKRTFKVEVYSACEKVELFLNGQSLGIKPATKAEKFIASFDVPYEPGELKAVGYEGDRPVDHATLVTASAPASIRLTPEQTAIQPGGDLGYVIVEVVDEKGCLHPAADNDIFFTTQGMGEIAAVGSGNPTSDEPYRGNQHRVHRGRCVVVVQSADQPGEIHLRAQSDGLDPAEVVIKVA